MKRIIVIFAALTMVFMLAGCGSDNEKAVRKNGTDGKYSITYYNKNDVCIRVEYYTKDGRPSSTIEYRDEGTRMRDVFYNTAGEISMVHEYNGKEACTRTVRYSAGKEEKYGIYDYDNYGTRISTTWYSMDGIKLSVQEYQDSFKLIKTVIYNPDGSIKETVDYTRTGIPMLVSSGAPGVI